MEINNKQVGQRHLLRQHQRQRGSPLNSPAATACRSMIFVAQLSSSPASSSAPSGARARPSASRKGRWSMSVEALSRLPRSHSTWPRPRHQRVAQGLDRLTPPVPLAKRRKRQASMGSCSSRPQRSRSVDASASTIWIRALDRAALRLDGLTAMPLRQVIHQPAARPRPASGPEPAPPGTLPMPSNTRPGSRGGAGAPPIGLTRAVQGPDRLAGADGVDAARAEAGRVRVRPSARHARSARRPRAAAATCGGLIVQGRVRRHHGRSVGRASASSSSSRGPAAARATCAGPAWSRTGPARRTGGRRRPGLGRGAYEQQHGRGLAFAGSRSTGSRSAVGRGWRRT